MIHLRKFFWTISRIPLDSECELCISLDIAICKDSLRLVPRHDSPMCIFITNYEWIRLVPSLRVLCLVYQISIMFSLSDHIIISVDGCHVFIIRLQYNQPIFWFQATLHTGAIDLIMITFKAGKIRVGWLAFLLKCPWDWTLIKRQYVTTLINDFRAKQLFKNKMKGA